MSGQDLLGDGNVKVTFCLTLSSTSTPPAAELNAGVDLQMLLIKEGLGIVPAQAASDNTALGSRSNTSRGGSSTYEINLTYKRKVIVSDDVAFTTLTPKQDGFLAIRRDQPHENPWAEDDPAEIYPVECGIYQRQPPVLDEAQRIVQQMFNHTDADTEAQVAA